MTDLKKLELKLAIDQHGLDIALREHPDLFYKVASELALAISNRDEAKQDVDDIEAVVDMELRRAASISEDKVTEKAIESNKRADKRVVSANDKFLEARFEAAKWAALKEAYESRSYALSKLVDLYLANYFSSQEDKKTGHSDFKDARANQIKEQNRSKRVSI